MTEDNDVISGTRTIQNISITTDFKKGKAFKKNANQKFTTEEVNRNMSTKKEVASIRADVNGLGYFELYMNGKRVGEDVLRQLFSLALMDRNI